jgi:hypothetical protein
LQNTSRHRVLPKFDVELVKIRRCPDAQFAAAGIDSKPGYVGAAYVAPAATRPAWRRRSVIVENLQRETRFIGAPAAPARRDQRVSIPITAGRSPMGFDRLPLGHRSASHFSRPPTSSPATWRLRRPAPSTRSAITALLSSLFRKLLALFAQTRKARIPSRLVTKF